MSANSSSQRRAIDELLAKLGLSIASHNGQSEGGVEQVPGAERLLSGGIAPIAILNNLDTAAATLE
jgi:hypothetical protein